MQGTSLAWIASLGSVVDLADGAAVAAAVGATVGS